MSKPKKNGPLIKNKNRINAFKGEVKDKLFCSKFSAEYKIFKKIKNAQFEFEKGSLFDSYNTALQKSGIDFRVPIFKLDFYNKSGFENLISLLISFKNLEDKGAEFSLFVFVDSYEKLKKVNKILNIVGFKRCLVRAYHCLEIDYKLLGAINFFNLNKEEPIRPNAKKVGRKKCLGFDNIQQSKLSFDKTKLKNLKGFSGLFVEEFGDVYSFENFAYKNLFEQKNIKSSRVEMQVKRTFDFENNTQFYIVKLQNVTSETVPLKICFGNVFDILSPKNIVYVSECRGEKFKINLKSTGKTLFFCGDKFEKILTSNFMGVVKNINLLPNAEVEICFAKFLDLNGFQQFDAKRLGASTFEETMEKYKNIALPTVFSANKGVNELINVYLPQKIFENTIVGAKANNIDFVMLKNLVFDAKIVNKEFVCGRLPSIYLLRQNLFSAYQNLLYFYFGIFPTRLGANVNTDKSLVLKDAATSFEVGKKRVVVRFKDLGLKNEVEINNVKYSNLKFLTFNNVKQGEVEVIY